jgi:hypothetical protein
MVAHLALAAAGDAHPAPNFCGAQRMALQAAGTADGSWGAVVTVANDHVIIPGCTMPLAFAGPLDAAAGGCLREVHDPPFEVPLALCLGPAPALAGPMAVRVCWAGLAPCTVEEVFLAGDLLAVRA